MEGVLVEDDGTGRRTLEVDDFSRSDLGAASLARAL